MSRYSRPLSPPGRRFEAPGRTSTGTIPSKSYEMPSSYSTREPYTSPRTSGERVIPISSETFVNGVPVGPKPRRLSYDPYAVPPRRSTMDSAPPPPRYAPPPSSSSSLLRPAVVHHDDRGLSPNPRPSAYDNDRYVTSAASTPPRKEHRKVYSIDDGKSNRLFNDPPRDPSRLEPLPPERQRRGYHLSGPAQRGPPGSSIDDTGAYEYTDPRGMYRDTEPKWRPRKGSVDADTRRERTASLIEPYGNTRGAARDGPPPTTWGLDKVNPAANVTRHGSLRSSNLGPSYSPPRTRDGRGSTASASMDDTYAVPPRIAMPKHEPGFYPSERGEIYSPSREDFDDRRDSRGAGRRWEDSEVASRGFGIRPPSTDARAPLRDESYDRRSGYSAEPVSARRDYPPEPVRDEGRREPDWREQERIRERDREMLRGKRDSPPIKDRDAPRDRDLPHAERDLHRDAPPRARDAPRERDRDRDRESHRDHDEPRRDKEREHGRDRDDERHAEEGRRHRDRRSERDDEHYERHEKDHDRKKDEHSHGGAALAGTAALGAAALGVKNMYDRRHRDGSRDDRERRPDDRERDRERERRPEADKERRDVPDERERRPTRPVEEEAKPRTEERAPPARADEERQPRAIEDRQNPRTIEDVIKPRRVDDSPEDVAPRRRHYVDKEASIDETERKGEAKEKQAEMLDPEEDYRRRIQQAQQELGRASAATATATATAMTSNERPRDEETGPSLRRQDRNVGNRDREEPPRERRDEDRRARVSETNAEGEEAGETQAVTRYAPNDEETLNAPLNDESAEVIENNSGSRRNRVSIVEPPSQKEMPKGILRKPTEKFPEDPNPIREGVAPLKDSKNKDVPPGARWTKISRALVNPEALEEAQERFEERQDHVIVLRVLTKEDIQKFADRTRDIRDARYERNHKGDRTHRHRDETGSDEEKPRAIGWK